MSDGREALRARLADPAAGAPATAVAPLPPYLEAFLAQLRLLIGVPFDYLVPHPELLPDESARFFFVDRNWTDHAVQGVLAVGGIGSREQALTHAHEPAIRADLDALEPAVRPVQRGLLAYAEARAAEAEGVAARATDAAPGAGEAQGEVVTGMLLRSAAVSGWPHMDVRAFDTVLPAYPPPEDAAAHQLTLLRLELLAPSVLLALWSGVPRLVWCEEPHHGVQLGLRADPAGAGSFYVRLRKDDGTPVAPDDPESRVTVPMRGNRTIDVRRLRTALEKARQDYPAVPEQTGSGALAVELLAPPWRQRFQGPADGPPEAIAEPGDSAATPGPTVELKGAVES